MGTMTPLLQGMFFLFLFFGLLLPCLALSQEGLGVSDKGGFYGNMGPEDEAEHEPDSLKPAPQGYVKSVVGLFLKKHVIPIRYLLGITRKKNVNRYFSSTF
jgi:hypothetical protein